ncbi:DUF4921 family protein [Georgenia sp. SYP-B2076]|uniref:DUF4921 family protein n=1 Tax=Georgenia sp. SYP-B2076 TaxID=2495881 RepID=UPI000F8DE85C|nr:DUF4921 family protein [Georgenia sp. SYP-B2076]
MRVPDVPDGGPLTRMADGTIKQVNPLTGTQVWTVPGRAHRPLRATATAPAPLDPAAAGRLCAFCERNYLRTPPEKSRLVRRAGRGDGGPGRGDGGRWEVLENLPAERLDDTVAEFRRVPNLFEILPYEYWRANYGYAPPAAAEAHRRAYLASPAGRAHVLAVVHDRLLAEGRTEAEWSAMTEGERLALSAAFFAGGHDLVVARRHVVDGATTDAELASAGTLTPGEHHHFTAYTAAAARSLYEAIPYARYVAVFQNWLRPAGASFDHLHKQLVAIDERGAQMEAELERLASNPDVFNDAALNYAITAHLVVAENTHAVAFAGFGHRYPTLEVYSKSAHNAPWEHDDDELRAVSDVVHACHAATGVLVPTNEEWHYRPVGVRAPMPWRIMLKWRISTVAGFEGGTKIYLNTIDPWALRDRVVARLLGLREQGRIAPMQIGRECPAVPGSLRYAAG